MECTFTINIVVTLYTTLVNIILILGQFSFLNSKLSRFTFNIVTTTSMTKLASGVLIILPIAIVYTILLLHTKRGTGIGNSTTMTVVSISSLTIKCLLLGIFSASTGISNSIYNALFNSTSVLALGHHSIVLYTILTIIALLIFVLFRGQVFSIAFSRDFSATANADTSLFGAIATIVTTLIVMFNVGLMNSLLVATLVIFPILNTVQLCGDFLTIAIYTKVFTLVTTLNNFLTSLTFSAPINTAVTTTSVILFKVYTLVKQIESG